MPNNRQRRFFHGSHDRYGFILPSVFCGDPPLVARHTGAILKHSVARLHRTRPEVRAASGFCLHGSRGQPMRRCERYGVVTILGLACNAQLGDPGGARGGDRERRVIARLKHDGTIRASW
ncbi:MAG: hypothetical protein OXC93_05245 [Rhodospirillaceae bacterium]|nr:hypothetical protein [Rhodospirillaceae bacterium]